MGFSFYRFKVVLWADIIALYTVWMVMPYLTDVWKLKLTEAAAIVNLFWASFYILLVFLLFLVDTLTANFWMFILSALSSSCGLGLLAMSTPPALYKITETCKEYQPECIGDEQKILFYIALALIAAGMSGQMVSFIPFVTEQIELITNYQADVPTTNSLVFLVAIVLLYINPWSIRFGVQAICTAAATVVMLSGACLYHRVKPQGSRLTVVFRVLVAATSKIFHRLPEDESRLYHGDGDYRIPHSRRLSCLDKAAIVEATTPLDEQNKRKWRLCRVAEVEETKSTLKMIPICLTFIIFGIISSLNSTFFVSQANQMNKKLGKLKLPIPILLWFHHTTKFQFMKNFFQLLKWIIGPPFHRRRRHVVVPQIGIAISIALGILCCMVAAGVETRRLRSAASGDTVSMFWLVPQFVLMGCMEGGFWSCVSPLFERGNVSPLLNGYLSLFAGGVIGGGFLGNIVVVRVVGRSAFGWFGKTVNESRLDKYYWVLAAMSAVGLVVYIVFVVLCHCCCGEPAENTAAGEEQGNGSEPVDINIRCCCFYFTYSRNY